MSFRARHGGVELEVSGAALARPAANRLEEALANALRAVGGIDGEVLDPAPVAEAHRVEVEVTRHEADDCARAVGRDEDGRVVRMDGLAKRDRGAALVPRRRPRTRWGKQPLV